MAAAPKKANEDDTNSETGVDERRDASTAAWRRGAQRRGGAKQRRRRILAPTTQTAAKRGAMEAGGEDVQPSIRPGERRPPRRERRSNRRHLSSSPEVAAASRRRPDEMREIAAEGPAPIPCGDPRLAGPGRTKRQWKVSANAIPPAAQDLKATQSAMGTTPPHPVTLLDSDRRATNHIHPRRSWQGSNWGPHSMGGDPSLWGRDGVEGMTMPTGIASTKNETKDPANMKRKRERKQGKSMRKKAQKMVRDRQAPSRIRRSKGRTEGPCGDGQRTRKTSLVRNGFSIVLLSIAAGG